MRAVFSQSEHLSRHANHERKGYKTQLDKRGKDRDDQGRQVGTVYAARIDNEKIGQTLRFRSKFEKLLAALYFGASKILVDCEEDDFSYGIYD